MKPSIIKRLKVVYRRLIKEKERRLSGKERGLIFQPPPEKQREDWLAQRDIATRVIEVTKEKEKSKKNYKS